MCKLHYMNLTAFRKKLGLSQEAFAAAVGLKSKGHVSQIEAGERKPSVAVALKIERLSEGRIDAAALNPDVAKVRQAMPLSGERSAA